MIYNELAKYAESIPSMGGRQIREYLFKYVKDVKEGRAIVELGTWLGAGTAQIALALLYFNKDNPVYSYDKFVVSGRQPMKAGREGWIIQKGDDVYDKVKKALEPFRCNITLVKGKIQELGYKKEKIGLYVDDAVKQEKRFIKTLKIFEPYFVPGETVCIFMDYYLWEKSGDAKYKFQYKYMNENKDKFELIEDKIDSTYIPEEGKDEGAVFLYKGG